MAPRFCANWPGGCPLDPHSARLPELAKKQAWEYFHAA
jgi:hypothetical protein